MHTATSTLLAILALTSSSLAGPIHLLARQSSPCFVIGDTTLPGETLDIANELASSVTCDTSKTTIADVPDVSSGGVTFSSISFVGKGSTLGFALNEFATVGALAQEDLALFENSLDVYLATEAGIRSVGGSLAIKVPKFFLAFQVARIKTAQGIAITDPGQEVLHLRDKVLKNAAGEDAALLQEVETLATQLS